MNAMLLCAGLGTRFRPTTEHLAKPVIPFLNVPLLGYSLADLEKLNPKNVVINTHYLPHSVETTAHSLTKGVAYKVHFSPENPILGSGGGIKAAEKWLTGKDSFVVANGDEIILFAHDRGYQPLLGVHERSGALATLLTTDHPEAGRSLGGVWADTNGQITRIGEKHQTGESLKGVQHFAGVFAFSPKVFQYMPTHGKPFHIFDDCLKPAIKAGQKVMTYHDPEMLWLETTDEKSYLESTRRALVEMQKESAFAHQLHAVFARYGQSVKRVEATTWVGEGAKFKGTLDPQAHLFMGAQSEVSDLAEINGFAVLGAGARFAQGYIESSVIAAQVHVSEMVSLRKQIVV